jgi:hypothetical protein
VPAVTESNHDIKICTVPAVTEPNHDTKTCTVPAVTESNHDIKIGTEPAVTESNHDVKKRTDKPSWLFLTVNMQYPIADACANMNKLQCTHCGS